MTKFKNLKIKLQRQQNKARATEQSQQSQQSQLGQVPNSPLDHRSHTTVDFNSSMNRRNNAIDIKYRTAKLYDERQDTALLYMAGRGGRSPMTNHWRSEENYRKGNRPNPRDREGRSRSPPPPPSRRGDGPPQARGRFERDDYQSRQPRKRDLSPESRRPPPRRLSISPRSPLRGPLGRSRYPQDSAYTSRESSPARFTKRRRTRSPSPSVWSDRSFDDRRRYSRSRSRDRYDSRDTRPNSRRGLSPRRSPLPRGGRPVSRDLPPDTDTYIPDRRRPASPVRRAPRRSPSPRARSRTPPPYRGRSPTPPRRYSPRPASRSSRYDSPLPTRRGPPRDLSPSPPRRKLHSQTPSIADDREQEPMDGPYAIRGHHGNSNFVPRGRGFRPYNNARGQYRGASLAQSPASSHHDSPNSNTSWRGGRGGWDGPQHQHSGHNTQSFRQNNNPGPNQSQDEYFRSQQQQTPHHPQPASQTRPWRDGRGRGRGQPFTPQGQHDRRFSGPESQNGPPPQRGRGAQFTNAPWHNNNRGRGGGSYQPANGPHSVRPSPALSHKGSRDSLPNPNESREHLPPRGPQSDMYDRREVEHEPEPMPPDTPQSQRDSSKISFAFKSRPPPKSPVRPPPEDLEAKARAPPTKPASDRPPPTQPKNNKFHEKRPWHQNQHHNQYVHPDRRRDDQDPSFRPPKGPQSQYHDRQRPPYHDQRHRSRSRSPPPKKLKVEAIKEEPFKPTLTPELASSDSVYYRKPGNASVIGAGTYGKVFKALHIYTKRPVALKKIRMEGERDGFPITAVREIKLLQALRHEKVVALQEVMVERNECFMVFEYMSHDLTGLINHPTFKLTQAHKKDLGRQMFEGLEFLHRRGVMHRDIKAANLLISSHGDLKYADFGLARFYAKNRKLDYTNRVITIWYRPPELLLGETQYSPAVDIWSAACVFMEMFTRKAIFPGEGGEVSQLERIYNVLGTPTKEDWPGIVDMPWYELVQPAISSPSSPKENIRERKFETLFNDILSPAAMALVTAIFSYDPAIRPDAAQILEHEYFNSESPPPRQCVELADVGGDWHEYESKAHRKENERKEKEKRKEEYAREKERRRKEGKSTAGISSTAGGTAAREGKAIDEHPAAPLPIGEEADGGLSGDEGSARMSMS